MNVNEWTSAHLLVYIANAVGLLSDFFIVYDIIKVGESNDDWCVVDASTLLHAGMYRFADVSRQVIVAHRTTGCDPNAYVHNIMDVWISAAKYSALECAPIVTVVN